MRAQVRPEVTLSGQDAIQHLREHVTFADLGTPGASMHMDAFCKANPDERAQVLELPDYRHVIEAFADVLAEGWRG